LPLPKLYNGLIMEHTWYLYILRCKDDTLYTGITTDVEKRLNAHRSGKGAKYTRGRAPLELVYQEVCGSHSQALKRELEVKTLSREEKRKLIEAGRKILENRLDKAVSRCYHMDSD